MQLMMTAKIKLNISVSELLETNKIYTKVFNDLCKIAFDNKITNRIKLHHKVYYLIRQYLPSQLCISVISKVKEAVKSVFKKKKQKYYTCPSSNCCSIRYDCSSYSLNLNKNQVSLLTINGRKKCNFSIPEYYRELFKTWKRGSAELCIVNKKEVYIHITFSKEVPDPITSDKVVGIDRGINNIAVSSNNMFFGGKEIKKNTDKNQRLRSALQKRGTKSAKRHLRKLSGREKRFKADINHCISKEIISSLKAGDTLVLEDLTGIRNRKLKKKQRTLINNWSFFQLETFLIYKAMNKGIIIAKIDPRYTSQMCSNCSFLHKSNRNRHNFCCKSCNFKLNSDLNASRNIRNKHLQAICLQMWAIVNEPIVSSVLQVDTNQSNLISQW